MSAQKTGMMAFLYGLVGLVMMGGNKSVPKLIQNAAKTAALWAARGFIAWNDKQEAQKKASKPDAANDGTPIEAFEKGALVRVVRGDNAGIVGRVQWDSASVDGIDGERRRVTISINGGRSKRSIVEEPGNVVLEPEKSPVADPVGGGGSVAGSGGVKIDEIPPFHEMVKAAIHAAWNVNLRNMAEGEEVLALIFAGPKGSEGDVSACANELQRLIELDPFKAAYESAHTLKYTFGKVVHRHDGRRVCIRIAPPSMWASLTTGNVLVFFGFTDSALATYAENTDAFSLAVRECRQRLIGPDGVEWGLKVDPDKQADEAANDVAKEDAGAPKTDEDGKIAVGDWVKTSPFHPTHPNVVGKVTRFEDYDTKVVLDLSNGGPMQVVTVELQAVAKTDPPVPGGSLRRKRAFGRAL